MPIDLDYYTPAFRPWPMDPVERLRAEDHALDRECERRLDLFEQISQDVDFISAATGELEDADYRAVAEAIADGDAARLLATYRRALYPLIQREVERRMENEQ